MDQYVIILRGVPCSGKSETMQALIKELESNDCYPIYFDKIESDLLRDSPTIYEDSMKRKYVIAEIFSGKEHLYEPTKWLQRYQTQGRKVLSVCLDIGYREGWERYKRRESTTDESLYRFLFTRFYTDPDMTNFSARAKVQEIRIEVQGKDPKEIAQEILSQLVGDKRLVDPKELRSKVLNIPLDLSKDLDKHRKWKKENEGYFTVLTVCGSFWVAFMSQILPILGFNIISILNLFLATGEENITISEENTRNMAIALLAATAAIISFTSNALNSLINARTGWSHSIALWEYGSTKKDLQDYRLREDKEQAIAVIDLKAQFIFLRWIGILAMTFFILAFLFPRNHMVMFIAGSLLVAIVYRFIANPKWLR